MYILIWIQAGVWTGEIDGGLPSQTDNTWFCLQGVSLACSSTGPQTHSRLDLGEPYLHLMQVQEQIQRWSQDTCANIALSTSHLMIPASAAPGTKPTQAREPFL